MVVKVGGATLSDLEPLWEYIFDSSRPVVLVHGGGRESTSLAERLGHEPKFVAGRRVTTELDLAIAEWTLRGSVNVSLVADAQSHHIPAVGISGVDGGLIRAQIRNPKRIGNEWVDFGWVGDITAVDPTLIYALLDVRYLPVVATLGADESGLRYNINADTVAGALAVALEAAELVFVTDTGGLRRHESDPDSVIARCDERLVAEGIQQGWIRGGMEVKVHVAQEALRNGVKNVFIAGPDDLRTKSDATRLVQ